MAISHGKERGEDRGRKGRRGEEGGGGRKGGRGRGGAVTKPPFFNQDFLQVRFSAEECGENRAKRIKKVFLFWSDGQSWDKLRGEILYIPYAEKPVVKILKVGRMEFK